MRTGVIVLLLVCFTITLTFCIDIKLATRSIALTTQVVRQNLTLNVENIDSDKFELAFPISRAQHLAFIQVTAEGSSTPLAVSSPISRSTPKNENYVAYEVTLPKSSGSVVLNVNTAFTHALEPFPASVQQNENQYLRYLGNLYLFSPYRVASQTTTVRVASSKIESNSEHAPFKVKGNTLTYGPYADIPAFSLEDLSVHFQSNEPILTVNRLEREVEISHWGNAAIEETYFLSHDGAKLTGHFSRYDYQRNPNGAQTVVRSIRQILPSIAADIYYRDEIGNISTSHVTEDPTTRSLNVELIPRFPLFGGWKTNFYMGYNLPLNSVLSVDTRDSTRFVLNFTALPNFNPTELVFDSLTTKVILPEGATDLKLHAPWKVDQEGKEVRFTYLDTSGRPVLVFRKDNLVRDHNMNVVVTYRFGRSSLLHEPILLVGAFFLFFLAAIVAVRVRLAIAPETDSD